MIEEEKKVEETTEPKTDANTMLADSFRACVNDGRLLGLKESLKALHLFLDRKVKMGYPEYISRTELQTFLDTYIKEGEENFR